MHLTYSIGGNGFWRGMNEADATLRGTEKLRYFLESGITSVRDVGSRDVTFRLKEWVRKIVSGPRVSRRGVHYGEGGHSTEKYS
jgi:imidazolonepropionase-like amidohydrolase